MKIKPCPICGKQPKLRRRNAHVFGDIWIPYWSVECNNLEPAPHTFAARSSANGSPKEAVETWNTRYEEAVDN